MLDTCNEHLRSMTVDEGSNVTIQPRARVAKGCGSLGTVKNDIGDLGCGVHISW